MELSSRTCSVHLRGEARGGETDARPGPTGSPYVSRRGCGNDIDKLFIILFDSSDGVDLELNEGE